MRTLCDRLWNLQAKLTLREPHSWDPRQRTTWSRVVTFDFNSVYTQLWFYSTYHGHSLSHTQMRLVLTTYGQIQEIIMTISMCLKVNKELIGMGFMTAGIPTAHVHPHLCANKYKTVPRCQFLQTHTYKQTSLCDSPPLCMVMTVSWPCGHSLSFWTTCAWSRSLMGWRLISSRMSPSLSVLHRCGARICFTW